MFVYMKIKLWEISPLRNMTIFKLHPESVLFLSLDSCRYDVFNAASVPNLSSIGPLHKAHSPSYYTYASHSSFWMGFTPGVIDCLDPWLNPKMGKLFRMSFAGSGGNHRDGFSLNGSNIIEGFSQLGYKCIGSGAVSWFNTNTPTGSVLTAPFHSFFYSGNTWSLNCQLQWIYEQLANIASTQPVFLFLNVGETHVPYWHEGANWNAWPSPCVPFGDIHSSFDLCFLRQRLCLEWVDLAISDLLASFVSATILACSDHGDCWGEDGLWEHGISHWATLTVPLLLRVRGSSI